MGTAAMAFAVGAVVVIFLLLCSKHIYQTPVSRDLYQIEFAKGFAGDSAIVYLNASIIWHDIVPTYTTQIRIHRFADENTLMVSRSREDAGSIFNIEKQAGRLILRKTNNVVSLTTLGWQ